MENKNQFKLENIPSKEIQKEIVEKIEVEKAALEQAVEEGRVTAEEKEEKIRAVMQNTLIKF